jgi:hypothetical protein
MIYQIISRFYFAFGIIVMFIPLATNRLDTANVLIPGGMIVGLIGVLTMSPIKKEKKTNDNILDDGEF